MKRKLILLSAVVICIAIAAAGTLAYFTADTTAHNVITSGGVDIDIQEWADTAKETPYDDATIGKVMPATKVTKIVEVINEPKPEEKTSAQAWIRAKVNVEFDKATVAALKEKGKEPDMDLVILKDMGEHWSDIQEDGYYYYTLPVDPGDVTEPLFAEVEFSAKMGNDYQNCSVTISITAHAVQTAHNPEPDADGNVSVWGATGWPGTDSAPAPDAGEGEGEESGESEGEESLPLQGEVARRAGGVDNESAATTTPQSADADSSPDKGSQDPVDPENP